MWVALVPEASDLLEGPTWQEYLAKVYAINGDAAHALPLAEHLLKTNGNTLTSAMLKLDPVWDPIREDPGSETSRPECHRWASAIGAEELSALPVAQVGLGPPFFV